LNSDIIVVGGGAAGMFAAAACAERGRRVLLVEKNGRLGKKLYITGKGRCNVTNNCTAEEVLRNVPRNGRFLFSAVCGYPPAAMMEQLEKLGCELKTERGNRVFPVSDRSASVIDALHSWMKQGKVRTEQAAVTELLTENGEIIGVRTEKGDFFARKVILCTGGCSYPLTGSDGSGYGLASALGHTVIEPVGSLVPLVEDGGFCARMQGLSLRNVRVRLLNQKNKVAYEDFGELLFTHFGLSGPTVLSASAHRKKGDTYRLEIDLKPALDEQKLDARILRDFEENQNRDLENTLGALLPRSMIPVVLEMAEVDGRTKCNSVTKPQRRALLETMKHFTVKIYGPRPVEEAIVTSGGIKVSEIDPKTMESKLISGLYFAGEIIDVDAYTGGFNLQIAWSTANAAAKAASI